MSTLPDSSQKPCEHEMWIHLLPALRQFSAEGAQQSRSFVPLLLRGFSEERHPTQQPAWQAGVKGQGLGAPAKNRPTDEPTGAEVPR